MNDAAVSMVSPLLELCGKIYGGKPLGLVSFGTEIGPLNAAIALVS
jgi:hypothetical protein